MKKKEIEKIPFLKLKKTNGRKYAKYVGVTEIKTVKGEEHLFLEIYQNSKRTKDVPVVRVVMTKKDFGNYFPETGTWTAEKIVTGSDEKLIWDKEGRWDEEEKKNVIQAEDLERIKIFCKKRIQNEKRWWGYIYRCEDEIASTKRVIANKKRQKRRREALNDRIEHTPNLPEGKILQRAETLYFHNLHYLYYKKHGNRATVACSKCGEVTDEKWKRGESYESQFERVIEEPIEGNYGKCPVCGAYGKYKCKGKAKGKNKQTIHIFLGQRYKENGIVMRYIEVEKEWSLQFIQGEKDLEMHSANEEVSAIEIARAYFEPGKKTQIDYHKHDWYRNEDFWDDCNLYGMKSISIKEAPIMLETYEEMKHTMFRYSALQEYAKEKEVNPMIYLGRYKKIPQIEILVKMGFFEIVKSLVDGYTWIVADKDAKRPDELLGIRKERVKMLADKRGDIGLLKAMQIEKSMQQTWTEEQIEKLAETRLTKERVTMIMRYMTLQKLLNRIEKYAGCEYGTKCSVTVDRIRSIATTYADYLSMRETLGYDLHNTVYQYPKDLNANHAKMVEETNKEEMDKHLKEVAEKYPNIRNCYRSLRRKYLYEDDEYIIRPAKSAEEIVMEGRILHHCVGGAGYLKKHNTGKSYILMLRFKKESDIPYITVEIDAVEYRIIQWYGAYDKKPDEKNMKKWIDNYLEKMKREEHIQEIRIAIA